MYEALRFCSAAAVLTMSTFAMAASPMPALPKLVEAQGKVAQWMKAVETDRVSITAAFERKDASQLERTSRRLEQAPGLPRGQALMQDEYGPFLKCDTAARDLALLAAAMARQAARPTDSQLRIVKQEQADFDRNYAECKRRLSMKPQDAWAQYQAE